jgi:hypothetical protein
MVGRRRSLLIRLGGLALAAAIMSSQIRLRKKSIAEFLNLYGKHSRRLKKERLGLESYCRFSLESCWQTAFEFFNPVANKLFGVVAKIGVMLCLT